MRQALALAAQVTYPSRHSTPTSRVIAVTPVFSCLLAPKLSREMERRLQAAFGTTDANPHAITLTDAMAALSRLCLLEYRVDEKTSVTRLPKPDARQQQILAALRVPLPKK